ncbi:MAG TPA: hypothetical protein VLA48_03255 [Nitrososphaeraceae archaeon]|nr:hypothetical protein [Nitrososphaeraceae archaeon]
MNIIQYWEGIVTLLGLGGGYWMGRKSRATQNKKEDAIAEQEQVKIKKEDVTLSQMIQETYQRLNRDFLIRLEELEKSNKDLTSKYNEILLRNAVLEERAETYESKYRVLEKQHTKLKADHDKLHAENREIRKELDELKEDKK